MEAAAKRIGVARRSVADARTILQSEEALGHDLGDRELWRRQDSANQAALQGLIPERVLTVEKLIEEQERGDIYSRLLR